MCTKKLRPLSYIGAEKITFPPKPDRQTYIRTDISIYRVASLLTKKKFEIFLYSLTNTAAEEPSRNSHTKEPQKSTSTGNIQIIK